MKEDYFKKLFTEGFDISNENSRSELLQIYFNCIEMADRVSSRRHTANSFFLSINTIFVGATVLGVSNSITVIEALCLSVAGASICLLWIQSIRTYRDLNAGKFAVINLIENELGIRPFGLEWSILERGENNSKYRQFHTVEKRVPFVFLCIYIVVIGFYVPWEIIFPFLVSHA